MLRLVAWGSVSLPYSLICAVRVAYDALVRRLPRPLPLLLVGILLVAAAFLIGSSAANDHAMLGGEGFQCDAVWPSPKGTLEPVDVLGPEEQKACDKHQQPERVAAVALVTAGALLALTGLAAAGARRSRVDQRASAA